MLAVRLASRQNEANQVPATWIGAVEIRRSAAHGFDGPPHGGSSPFSDSCKRLQNVHGPWSPLQRLDRSPQRAGGYHQLPLGFVDRRHDVFLLRAEEGCHQRVDALAV